MDQHWAVSVAPIHPVIEPGQVTAVMFGTGTVGVSGAAVVAGERAGAQDPGELLGIEDACGVAVVV
jgi:hypothetical protein